ncbi:MAG: endonuclease/exonuclease/phosphatase family protein [Nannocystaceae bacterium]|nr:endonuclease/exonuclease/phosphatase family protein [Nannocystaceae bacterium]
MKRRWLAPAVVAAAVLVHAVATGVRCGDEGRDDRVRVLSWNLHNFRADDHDQDAIAAAIAQARADVVVLQEVLEPDALAAVLPGAQVLVSRGGGSGRQHLAIALAPGVELVSGPHEHAALELGGRVRPALSVRVRVRDETLQVIAVHLKATPEGLARRRVQWAALAHTVASVRSPALPHEAMIVIGDFNATGDDALPAADERAALAAVLAPLQLRPLLPTQGCSAYWDGVRRDAWLEPTLLDLAFVAGWSDAAVSLTAHGACARHACAPLRSTDAYPDADLAGTSDHCPILLRVQRATAPAPSTASP